METHRIHASTDPAFAALATIYTQALPASERKSTEQLSSMLRQPEYLFLAATHQNAIVGFSITRCFTACEACLLEYMAVAADRRGHGIGRYLFTEVAKRSEVSGRFLLAEVDSDIPHAAHTTQAAKRKAFYQRLGCKEVEGLRYLMPQVAATQPPAMNLLAFSPHLPPFIEKPHLRAWLQSIYVEVYCQPSDAPRINQMLEDLPANIPLTDR